MVEFSNFICATEPPCSAPLHLQQLCRKKGRYLPFMPPPPPYPSQSLQPRPLTHRRVYIPTPLPIVALHLYPLTHRSTMRTLIFKLFFVIPITVSGILHPQPDNILLIQHPYSYNSLHPSHPHLYGTMPLLYPLKPIALSFLHTINPTPFPGPNTLTLTTSYLLQHPYACNSPPSHTPTPL